MCVKTVIDASAFRHLTSQTKNTAGFELQSWVQRRDGLIVYSASNTAYAKELSKNYAVQELLVEWGRRGQAVEISESKVNAALKHVPGKPTRKSNDPHVLAVAKAGRAQVLFSCDEDLQKDFANTDVLCKLDQSQRRSVPYVVKQDPENISGSSTRRNFFGKLKCTAKH